MVGGEPLEDAALVEDFGFDHALGLGQTEPGIQPAPILFKPRAGAGNGRRAEQAEDATAPRTKGDGDVEFHERRENGGGGLRGVADDDALDLDQRERAVQRRLLVASGNLKAQRPALEADMGAGGEEEEAGHGGSVALGEVAEGGRQIRMDFVQRGQRFVQPRRQPLVGICEVNSQLPTQEPLALHQWEMFGFFGCSGVCRRVAGGVGKL